MHPLKKPLAHFPKAAVMKLQLPIRPTFAARPHATTRASCLGPTYEYVLGTIYTYVRLQTWTLPQGANWEAVPLHIPMLVDTRTHLHFSTLEHGTGVLDQSYYVGARVCWKPDGGPIDALTCKDVWSSRDADLYKSYEMTWKLISYLQYDCYRSILAPYSADR